MEVFGMVREFAVVFCDFWANFYFVVHTAIRYLFIRAFGPR